MCFKISKEDPKVKNVTKDIKCFKVLQIYILHTVPVIRAPYYGKEYQLGKVATVNRLVPNVEDGERVINKGLHSYANLPRANRELSAWGSDYKMFEAIIPKGAKYYQNDNNEYVSDKLIITKRYRKPSVKIKAIRMEKQLSKDEHSNKCPGCIGIRYSKGFSTPRN